MSSPFTITFRLKSNLSGTSMPYLYGNHPSLGNNDPTNAIPLTPTQGPYNYMANVLFDEEIKKPLTYSYFFKTQFGGVLNESVPVRTLPKFVSDGQVYDSINSTTSISCLVVKFRVRYNTNFGQEVYITGNVPELGDWSETASIPLFFEGHDDFWSTTIAFPLSDQPRTIEYKYIISNQGSIDFWEPEENHKLVLKATPSPCVIEVDDQYRWKDPVQQAFTRDTFTKVVNRRENPSKSEVIEPEKVKPGTVKTFFRVNCPHVRSTQDLYVIGSIPQLGSWDTEKALKLSDGEFPNWTANLALHSSDFPFEYKYIIKTEDDTFIWEQASNRVCPGITLKQFDPEFPKTLYINDWYTSPNKDFFKGLGVYVPLFSLRTLDSQGIGSYTDIKKLVDVCVSMGASLIQLLPVNDTTNNGSWEDSYPYKQVSCFALNPIYIDLLAILDKLPSDIYHQILNTKSSLENRGFIDYPAVSAFKTDVLKKIFKLVEKDFAKSVELENFIDRNGSWLKPYALFIHYRNKYGTMEFRTWPKHVKPSKEDIEDLCDRKKEKLLYTYWVQYIADVQFKASYDYASEHKVALKGDLPIGVNINSVECWAFPELFRLDMCAGAPPDDFSADGQNWGFPTYDWDAMEKDGFAWWKSRLQRMAELYHTLRVDHILGFFRIWEIPRDTCVRGLLGHFYPSKPLTRAELDRIGLWDIDRLVKPYIKYHLLQRKFGSNAQQVADTYFVARGIDTKDDTYDFKEEYDTERKISDALNKDLSLTPEERADMQQKLFELIGNVILIKDLKQKDCYHVRTEVARESVKMTREGPVVTPSSSWEELSEGDRKTVIDLYNDFTYRRQTDLWVQKAIPKLGVLQNSTKMLICGEDLGQITSGIIKCLESTGLLSLRVQRMSKDPSQEFDDYEKFAYLSVACPSTHDTSSLRGWWEESRKVSESFWRNVMHMHEPCPHFLNPQAQEMILRENMESNSMWAIFLLQDLTGINNNLRRQLPHDERINLPSNPNQHWGYRYPYTLEELNHNTEFLTQMRSLVEASHRI